MTEAAPGYGRAVGLLGGGRECGIIPIFGDLRLRVRVVQVQPKRIQPAQIRIASALLHPSSRRKSRLICGIDMAATVQLQTQQLEVAHVLFMDIAGYVRLPSAEQNRLLQELQGCIRSTKEFSEERARDQIISLECAEGIALVFFGDPEAPLRCAMEVNHRTRTTERIRLRMGLHPGLVYRVPDIDFNRSVSGGRINVAQRVMDCGDTGHILVSNLIADLLRQMGHWNECLHDLGEVEIKGGMRLHILNFWNNDIGNPKAPKQLADMVPRDVNQPLSKLSPHA